MDNGPKSSASTGVKSASTSTGAKSPTGSNTARATSSITPMQGRTFTGTLTPTAGATMNGGNLKVGTTPPIAKTPGSTGGGGAGGGTGGGTGGMGIGGYAGLASSAIGTAGNISNIMSGDGPSYRKKAQAVQAGVDGVTTALATTGPWGVLAASVIKGVDVGGKYLRTVPTAVKKFGINEELSKSSAFSGTVSSGMKLKDQADAMSKGGFFSGLTFNRKKMVKKANELSAQQNIATGIKRENDIAKDSAINSGGMFNTEITNRQNGIDAANVTFGKRGMKILRKDDYSDLFDSVFNKKPVEMYENGGKFNVIANGVLHEEENNISENEQFKDADITEKGIPVISFEEGGEIKQHAEVEKDELVLNLDATETIEKLFNNGSEAAMIKAGKLFAKEIIKNTKDSKSKIIENA